MPTGSPEVDNDIAIYADAVARMKELPANDPRSWTAPSGMYGSSVGFNYYQHGTNHFFTWHRAYLFYCESICRELTGEANWGLPYWNWNQDPLMHPAFTDPASTLKHPRNTNDLSGNSAFSDATLVPMFAHPDFFTHGSQIEGSSHNMAHSVIGQDMVTGGSPLDPIFWMHHNLVDYCWWKWNIELGNSLPSDPMWHTPHGYP